MQSTPAHCATLLVYMVLPFSIATRISSYYNIVLGKRLVSGRSAISGLRAGCCPRPISDWGIWAVEGMFLVERGLSQLRMVKVRREAR
jgi:hypothetical protein